MEWGPIFLDAEEFAEIERIMNELQVPTASIKRGAELLRSLMPPVPPSMGVPSPTENTQAASDG